MGRRSQHAWLGCALLAVAGCHLVVGSRGDEPLDTDGSPVGAHACGPESCGGGDVCCNASCGICSAPGEVCIQIACDPDNAGSRCGELSCPTGQRCMEAPAGAQCVPAAEDPCTKLVCAANQTCAVTGGVARCSGQGADAGATLDAGTRSDAGASFDAGKADAGQVDAGRADAGGNDAATQSDASATPDASTTPDAAPPSHDASPPDASPPGDTGITPISCAVVLCPAGSYCAEVNGTPRCIKLATCDTVKCAPGQHCELDQTVCVQAPCPQVPICVDDPKPTDPCATVKCKVGTHCEVVSSCAAGADVVAPRPCESQTICVADTPGGSCGGNECGPGKFCCNASCGICTTKRGACLDVICDPVPVSETR
jgi:hypothetical protein